MGLSIMMTTASTLAAIVMTPLLTTWLAGTLVPVDPRALFMSTLQVRPDALLKSHSYLHACLIHPALCDLGSWPTVSPPSGRSGACGHGCLPQSALPTDRGQGCQVFAMHSHTADRANR